MGSDCSPGACLHSRAAEAPGGSAPGVLPLGTSLQGPLQAQGVEAELLGGFSQFLSSGDRAEASGHGPSELQVGNYLFPFLPTLPHLCPPPLHQRWPAHPTADTPCVPSCALTPAIPHSWAWPARTAAWKAASATRASSSAGSSASPGPSVAASTPRPATSRWAAGAGPLSVLQPEGTCAGSEVSDQLVGRRLGVGEREEERLGLIPLFLSSIPVLFPRVSPGPSRTWDPRFSPFPSPLPGIESKYRASPALAGRFFTTGSKPRSKSKCI